ncbi:hypothetical protein MHYP_G00066580 [Metynnis hypsauchen]
MAQKESKKRRKEKENELANSAALPVNINQQVETDGVPAALFIKEKMTKGKTVFLKQSSTLKIPKCSSTSGQVKRLLLPFHLRTSTQWSEIPFLQEQHGPTRQQQ